MHEQHLARLFGSRQMSNTVSFLFPRSILLFIKAGSHKVLESGPYPLVITAEGTSLITVANSTNRGESPTALGGGNFFSEKTLDLSKKELLNLSLVDQKDCFSEFLQRLSDLHRRFDTDTGVNL